MATIHVTCNGCEIYMLNMLHRLLHSILRYYLISCFTIMCDGKLYCNDIVIISSTHLISSRPLLPAVPLNNKQYINNQQLL